MSQAERQYLERLAEKGQPPRQLLEQPELPAHLIQTVDAFFLLCPDRPIGGMGGVGAISTTAIFAMAEELGEPKARFLALCRAMDGVYLEHVAAKQKADAEKQKLSAKTRTRR